MAKRIFYLGCAAATMGLFLYGCSFPGVMNGFTLLLFAGVFACFMALAGAKD